MRHIRHIFAAGVASLLALSATQAPAATVELEWGDPAKFRDIRAASEGQVRFQEQVMSQLEEIFRKKGTASLEEGQTLHISVKDVDLAGEIEYFHPNYPQGLRIVRNVDSPAFVLSYELRDADGSVLKSGEDRIRDLGFNYKTLNMLDRTPLRHEKELINQWYEGLF